ncbi:hypothetical protein DSC45_27885 [Streptomyces sp. YIM 130001]|uniref:hypothetical protein n=1 Tax=Streptomyces sp. YIM 130001 TaxID=2259644 RepID=UPI000E64C9D8|nr:hypothetical protein [Streptomyces sp. YIM 130001]RII11735.1 hypothetical protein DSC45_27885 [Streptomyces sp. YIM 130001]
MQINRGTLLALFALPLVLAGVFAWVLWDMKTLSDDELQEVVNDSMHDLEQARYDDNGSATVRDGVSEAVEDSAQQHDVPLPHVRIANSSNNDSDKALITYWIQVSEEGDNDGRCITLVQRERTVETERVTFEPDLSTGPCPDGS